MIKFIASGSIMVPEGINKNITGFVLPESFNFFIL